MNDLSQERIDSLTEYFETFLTYEDKENLLTDVTKWKKYYEGMEERPKSAIAAYQKCSPQIYPTLHKIFTIFLTTPVGSVSCERSFSALRRLKLWTRSTMKQERLSGLVMMLLHRGTNYIPIPEEVYLKKSNWRLEKK